MHAKSKSLSLFIMLLLSLSVSFNINIKPAHASSEPSDGDAWTENDNATYPWTTKLSGYNDLDFVTDNAQVGTYCLRINVTQAGGGHYGKLDLGSEQDFSSYTYMVITLRCENILDASKFINLAVSNSSSAWTTNRLNYRFSFTNGTDSKFVAPLDAFYPKGTVPTLTTIRYIYIQVESNDVGDLVFLDGLRFETAPTLSASNSPDDLHLPNIWANIPNDLEHLEWNTSDSKYTFLYQYSNSTSGESLTTDDIEVEMLGHAIFSLCIAYNYTHFSYLLDKAEEYADSLLFLQLDDAYGGVRDAFKNGTKQWADKEGVGHNGWALAGISLLYGMTANSSYSDLAHDIRHLLCDVLWNETNICWYNYVVPSTGVLSPANPSWDTQHVGGATTGLATYYRYVQENSTVKDIIQSEYQYLYDFGDSTYDVLYTGKISDFESATYWWWAMHMAGMALNNSTYTNADNSVEAYAAWTLINSNGYPSKDILPWETITNETERDNWGASCMSLLLLLNYLNNEDATALKAYEVMVLDYFNNELTSYYYMPRTPNSGDAWEHKTWNGQTFFHWASLMLYYYEVYEPNPYPILTTATEITSSIYGSDRLDLTINGTGTSTTYVYCGSEGQPTSVSGATSYSYNAITQIETIIVTHSSSELITIDWGETIPSSGYYEVKIYCQIDGAPLSGVNITAKTGGSIVAETSTGLFGTATLELPYGSYIIRATYEKKTETMHIWLNRDMDIGFAFKESKKKANLDVILIPAVICIACAVFLLFRRRR